MKNGDSEEWKANAAYQLVCGIAASPIGVVLLVIPTVGRPLAAGCLIVVVIRALRTGVTVDATHIVVRNFWRTSRIGLSEIASLGREELAPERVLWRMSTSEAVRIETLDGRVVHTFCLTEGPSLLPAPGPPRLQAIVDRAAAQRVSLTERLTS